MQSESDMYGKVLYRALYSGCPIGQSTNEKGAVSQCCHVATLCVFGEDG